MVEVKSIKVHSGILLTLNFIFIFEGYVIRYGHLMGSSVLRAFFMQFSYMSPDGQRKKKRQNEVAK